MRVAFLGDIAFLGQFDKSRTPDAETRIEYLREKLQVYDVVIANLESPLTTCNHTLTCKSMHLKANPCNVELLEYLGISAVTLANNHIADYGIKGLKETIKTLDSVGIGWYGVNEKTWIKEVDDDKYCFSGFCCYSTHGTHYGKNGINLLTRNCIEKRLTTDANNGEFSIISVHWGMEHTNYPAYEHIGLMHNVLKNNRAIVVGHHTHVMQGIEVVDESIVAYSLGNAIFDSCTSINGKMKLEINESNRRGYIFHVTISDGVITESGYDGFYIGNNGIEPLNVDKEIQEYSEALHTNDLEKYEALRREQFKEAIAGKFGKHNLIWLLNRLNYYAVGAKIAAKTRNKKYANVKAEFIKP